jgi:hypothetical protein
MVKVTTKEIGEVVLHYAQPEEPRLIFSQRGDDIPAAEVNVEITRTTSLGEPLQGKIRLTRKTAEEGVYVVITGGDDSTNDIHTVFQFGGTKKVILNSFSNHLNILPSNALEGRCDKRFGREEHYRVKAIRRLSVASAHGLCMAEIILGEKRYNYIPDGDFDLHENGVVLLRDLPTGLLYAYDAFIMSDFKGTGALPVYKKRHVDTEVLSMVGVSVDDISPNMPLTVERWLQSIDEAIESGEEVSIEETRSGHLYVVPAIPGQWDDCHYVYRKTDDQFVGFTIDTVLRGQRVAPLGYFPELSFHLIQFSNESEVNQHVGECRFRAVGDPSNFLDMVSMNENLTGRVKELMDLPGYWDARTGVTVLGLGRKMLGRSGDNAAIFVNSGYSNLPEFRD